VVKFCYHFSAGWSLGTF